MNSSICLLAKDENDYINEWLEWHLNLGFERVFIYDNESTIPIIESISKDYINYCDIINWTTNDYKKHMQVEAYADCLKKHKHDTKWLAFIDADEFIRLITATNINDFLKDYENYMGIYIEWLTYNANGLIKKDVSIPVRERFTQLTDYTLIHNTRGKSIVQPSKVNGMTAHFPITSYNKSTMVDSDFNKVDLRQRYDCPLDKIVIDHYYTKSYEEWCEKLSKGSCCPLTTREMEEFYILNPDLEKNKINIIERNNNYLKTWWERKRKKGGR